MYARRMVRVIGVGYLVLVLMYASPLIALLLFRNSGEDIIGFLGLLVVALASLALAIGLAMVVLLIHYSLNNKLNGGVRIVATLLVVIYVAVLYGPIVVTMLSHT